jgi:outer membrane protein TolC
MKAFWYTPAFMVSTLALVLAVELRSADLIQLNLKEAVELALRPESQDRLLGAQVGTRLAAASVGRARTATALAVDASVTDSIARFDLRALGIDFPQVSPFVSNITLPAVVGPFSLLDARINATKPLFDRAASGQVKTAQSQVEAVRMGEVGAREQVAADVAKAYLKAALAQSMVEMGERFVKEAAVLVDFEKERKARGLVTGADVRRAQLELSEAQQRLAAARSDSTASVMELRSALGVEFGPEIRLSEPLDFGTRARTVDQALSTALRARPELARNLQEAQTLQFAAKAIEAQKLPSVLAFGNVGLITTAPTPNKTDAGSISYTYTAGVSLRVPIFDGGRRAAQLAEVDARRREVEISRRQLRRQVELEIRLTMEKVRAAEEQVRFSEQQMSLAQEDIEQVRGRYQAGEATAVEVSAAQTRRYGIQQRYLEAVYRHNLARLAVGQATGTVAEMNW